MFKNKIVLITGGTGSFGRQVLSCFYQRMSANFVYFVVMSKSKK